MADVTPLTSVQHDWEISLNSTNPREVVWVTSSTYDNQNKKTNTKNGEITFVRNKDGVTASASSPFSVNIVNPNLKWISVQNTETNTSTDIFAPTRQTKDASKKPIYSLGLSPQGGLAAFGSDDGILRVCDTQDATIMRNLEGHKGDVTLSKFFPSGQVVLSGALDWRLKIWNVATGDCAATLTGHAGSVLGADFIERGRNIISCSRDGTAKLWDVPTSTVIATFATPGDQGMRSAVNDCCVFANAAQAQGGATAQDLREVGTEGKAIATAGEDGVLRVFDIRTRNETATFAAPPAPQAEAVANAPHATNAFNCCAGSSAQTLVGGTESGHIVAWDLRNPAEPLHTLRLTSAAIRKLAFSASGKLWATTGDGAAVGIRAANATERTRVDVSLTGPDYEPIFGLGVATSPSDGATVVATGARDGVVRFYSVHE